MAQEYAAFEIFSRRVGRAATRLERSMSYRTLFNLLLIVAATIVVSGPASAQSSDVSIYRQRDQDRSITRRQAGDRSLKQINSANEVRRRLLIRQRNSSIDDKRSVPIIPSGSRTSVVVNQ